jgi:hypothetical protein
MSKDFTKNIKDYVVSVKDFGAKGDGVTDDTVAIQSALDSSQGTIVTFPKGVYRCTSTLYVPSGTTLEGMGVGGWRANPFSSQADVTLYDLTTGSNLLFTGDGAKVHYLDFVTKNDEAGFSRSNINRLHNNANDEKFELYDYTNEDASGTTKATLKPFSVCVMLGDGIKQHRTILRNLRVVTSCPSGSEVYGTAGYAVQNEILPWARWDIGVWSRSGWDNAIYDSQVVGYYGINGLLITTMANTTPYEGTSPNLGFAENFSMQNTRIQSGLAIRSGDVIPVLSKTSNSITVEWSASHRFNTSGSLTTDDGTLVYTGLTYTAGSPNTLTFTGIANTSNVSSTAGGTLIRRTHNGGLANTSFINCEISDFGHSSRTDRASDSYPTGYKSKYRPALEMSGHPLRGVSFIDCLYDSTSYAHIHLGLARDIEFNNCYGEPKAYKLTPTSNSLSGGGLFICGPRSTKDYGRIYKGVITNYGITFVGNVNREPLVPVITGTRVSGFTDVFNPAQYFDNRWFHQLGTSAAGQKDINMLPLKGGRLVMKDASGNERWALDDTTDTITDSTQSTTYAFGAQLIVPNDREFEIKNATGLKFLEKPSNDNNVIHRNLAFNASDSTLTISSGAITVTNNFTRIDTEGSAALDELTTINKANSGGTFPLWLRTVSSSRDVLIKHQQAGNIRTFNGQDILLDHTNKVAFLFWNGVFWHAISLDSATTQLINAHGDTDWMHMLLYGQSLSYGASSTPVISTTQPYNNVKMNGTVITDNFIGTRTSFDALVETSRETPTSGMLNKLKQRLGNTAFTNTRFIGTAAGDGGQTLEQLGKGSFNFNRMIGEIQSAKNIATGLGDTYQVGAMGFVHGESAYRDALSSAEYQRQFLNFKRDFADAVSNVTRQNNVPVMITAQTASSRYYAGSTKLPTIALIQAAMAKDYKDITIACPIYCLEHAEDNLHLSAEGSRMLGYYLGLAAKRTVFDKVDWRPLEMIALNVQPTFVDVKHNVPYGKIQFKTGIVADTTNKGFDIYDETNTLRDIITAVQIINFDTVRLTLSSPLAIGDSVCYAWGRSSQNGSSFGGNATGPRGNLCDQQGDIENYTGVDNNTRYLDNYALVGKMTIGESSFGGTDADTAAKARANLGIRPEATRELMRRPTLTIDGVNGVFFKRNRAVSISQGDLLASSFATFTRATASLYTDVSGTIRSAASGVPTYNYPRNSQSGGLGIFRAATNLIEWSQDFGNAWWTKTNATVPSTTGAGAPDGTATVNTIQASAGAGIHGVQSTSMGSLTTTDNYGYSVYLAAGTASKARIKVVNSSSMVIGQVDIDLTTFVASGVDALNCAIFPPVGNSNLGRVELYPSAAIGTTSATVEILILDGSGNESYTAAGTETILAWGAQFERYRPTPYLLSAGSSGARNADTLTLATTEEWYGTPRGITLAMDTVLEHFNGPTTAEYRRYLFTTRLGITDFIKAYVVGNQIVIGAKNNNDTVTLTTVAGVTLTPNTQIRLAVSTNGANVNVGVNGTTFSFARTLRPNVFTQLSVGANESDLRQLNARLGKLDFWPLAMTANQLGDLTR